MKKKVFVALVTPILVLTGCKATTEMSSGLKNAMLKAPELSSVDKPSSYDVFSQHVNEFCSKFTESALKDKDNTTNYAVSPVSVFMALAMTVESSSGDTRQEILNALGVTYEELQENIQYFASSLNREFECYTSNSQTKKYGQIKLTNSIWYQKGLSVKEKLLTVLSQLYNSYSFQTDFKNNNKKANELVREFIKKQTNGLIDQDLEINASTLVVLLNTLYFKDTWNDYGEDLDFTNENYTFKMEDESTKDVKLLQGYYNGGKIVQCDNYRTFYTKTVSGASLTFVVPNEGISLSSVFTKETINECANRQYVYEDDEKMERYLTRCYFPEFSASYDKSLKDILVSDFGMVNAFDADKADFSNTCDEDLFIDNVKHVVKLNVTKSGIEGAAVTVVMMAGSSAPVYTDVYDTFVVDRSFGYVLTYKSEMIFSGIVQRI